MPVWCGTGVIGPTADICIFQLSKSESIICSAFKRPRSLLNSRGLGATGDDNQCVGSCWFLVRPDPAFRVFAPTSI